MNRINFPVGKPFEVELRWITYVPRRIPFEIGREKINRERVYNQIRISERNKKRNRRRPAEQLSTFPCRAFHLMRDASIRICEIDESDEMLFSAHLFMLYGKQSTRERERDGRRKKPQTFCAMHTIKNIKRGIETLWFQ